MDNNMILDGVNGESFDAVKATETDGIGSAHNENTENEKKKRHRRTQAEMKAARDAEVERFRAEAERLDAISDENPAWWPIRRQLLRLQQEVSCPKELKNADDRDQFRYRSMESILAAVKPMLGEMSCVIVPDVELRETAAGNYLVAKVSLVNLRGESVSSSCPVREDDSIMGMCRSQMSGACRSYAVKYALGQLLAIDDTRLAAPVELDSIPRASVREAQRAEPAAVASPELRSNDTQLPVLRCGTQAFSAEAFNLMRWTGTREAYIASLRSRFLIDDDNLTILFSSRNAPFAA